MKKNHQIRRAFHASAILVSALLIVPSSPAVTFMVNSFLDQPDNQPGLPVCHTVDGTCTLRAAIMKGNVIGDTFIQLQAGTYKLTIQSSADGDHATGDLDLYALPLEPSAMAISGAGSGLTIIDGNLVDRVFRVHGGLNATISGVTIRNGFTAQNGGAIYNAGILSLSDVVIDTFNHSGGNGGAIFNTGELAISDSAISGSNSVNGGGIYNTSTLTFRRSTISGNHSDRGGGIYNFSTGNTAVVDSSITQNTVDINGGGLANETGVVTIWNSTIDNNGAGVDGGGLYSTGTLTLVNSTLSQNHAGRDGGGLESDFGEVNIYNTTIIFNDADADVDFIGVGGGIYNWDAAGSIVNLRNSILAGNYISNSPTYQECDGTVNSYGRNIFWAEGLLNQNGMPNNCHFPIQTGTVGYADSLSSFGPLQDNGGPTKTHALRGNSNMIDSSDVAMGCIGPDSNLLPVDQRGLPRIAGEHCDPGAYEYTSIDIDGNGIYDALTDGMLIVRYLFGVTGNALTAGAIGPNPKRSTPTEILNYLASIRSALDIDKNNQPDGFTDGVLALRRLFGLNGSALTAGAVAGNAPRTGAQIESYLKSLMP